MQYFTNFIPADLYEKFVSRSESFLLPSYQKKTDLATKPISIFNDYTPNIRELKINPRNILIIQEPNQLFSLHNWAIQNQRHFDVILTWGESILAECPNAMLHNFGTSFLWETPDFYKQFADVKKKKFGVSFLCGQKNQIEGHHLRHRIFQAGNLVKIPKLWLYTCPPGAGKNQCWDSMFHIAIENSRNTHYFTEKIIDSFLTRTVPVYWGCPNLPEYFNRDGFIVFEDVAELIEKVNKLTPDDYHSRLPVIQENYEKALYHGDFFYRTNEILEMLVGKWKL